MSAKLTDVSIKSTVTASTCNVQSAQTMQAATFAPSAVMLLDWLRGPPM
jgi:hypothetical protein